MNGLLWPLTKQKVIQMINNRDVKGLKEFINSGNLDNATLDKINNLFIDMFYSPLNEILELFDENGKCIVNHREYLYNPSFMSWIINSDPSVKEAYNEEEQLLLNYYNKEMKSGRLKDAFYSFETISHEIEANNKPLSTYFDGTELKKEAYSLILKDLIISYPNMKDFSQEFQSHFTEFELNLIKAMRNSDDTYSIGCLIGTIKREDIPKCIKLNRRGIKLYPEIIISEDTLPLMIYATSLKRNIPDELKQKIYSSLNEVQAEYFLLNDENLDKLLLEYNVGPKELNTLIYLKDGKLLFEPHFVSKLLENKRYSDLFNILNNYFDNSQLNNIEIKDPNLSIESLIKVSNIYSNIEKLPDHDMALNFIIQNLEEDINILHLNSKDLNHLQKVLLDLASRIYNSNAPELKAFGGEILYQILKNGNDYDYKKSLDGIEEIFTKNNLPVAAKKFLIFKILNPNLDEYFVDDEFASPTLVSANSNERFNIIFNDIMRITLGSNNVSMTKYLENIYYGNRIYEKIIEKKISVENLPIKEKEILEEFLMHLCTIYNNTKKGKEENYTLSGHIESDLEKLIPLFKPSNRYSLPDRIIRMYCYGSGFKTFSDVYEYMHKKIKEADTRGRQLATKPLTLEVGDLIKGIGSEEYLYDILQNGSLCKEFLGPHMTSDATPLDTDLSMILEKKLTISSTIEKTISNGYGPIYFIIKKDKFPINRKKAHEKAEFTTNGPECFATRSDEHFGIRTGFASSDIDYIIIDQQTFEESYEHTPLEEIGFTIALNGIYIPVIDRKTGTLIFSPEQYDDIRNKMDGLSYYGIDTFKISENLKVPTDYDNKSLIDDARRKKEKINNVISNIMKTNFDLDFKTRITPDISTGSVELIDTGSTGRGTNVNMKADFDFIMRIDERSNRKEIAQAICEGLGIEYEDAIEKGMIVSNNNLRLKSVKIPELDTPIDMDITFLSKADQVEYTTDMALNDRLETIRKIDSKKYEDVLDNIIYAKEYLKSKKVYKPKHSPDSQGGLGGVGIENWVLQNGGSFYDACKSFYDAATEHDLLIPYEKFIKKYKIHDFGVNFYNKEHDEFISQNMTSEGYINMYKAVKQYLLEYQKKYPIAKKQDYSDNKETYRIKQESISKGISR